MRNRRLHDALKDFALEAAAFLTEETKRGAELGFELAEEPGTGSVLYRYRPLTSEFIEARWQSLRALPTRDEARKALGSGADAYLRVCGVHSIGADAEPALRAMLERLYEDQTGFHFPEERFEHVYEEVERTLYENTLRTIVLVPVANIEIESERVDLGGGLALAYGQTLDAPTEAVWPGSSETGQRRGDPAVLCVLERTVPADAPLPVTEARIRFRELLTGLRLYRSGGVAFSGLGWARADEGTWQPVAIGASGHARTEPWQLPEEQEPELREFLALVARSKHVGAVSWALGRFEMGCERALETEALSDYLLALRALLDAGDELGRASISLRLAALCAGEGERRAVQRRVELAFSLERFLIEGRRGTGPAGEAGEAYMHRVGTESPHALVQEMEGHLRALLRDVLCGYLEPDLKTAADDILLASGEPIEIRARDLREGEAEPAGADDAETGELEPVAGEEGAGEREPAEEAAADDVEAAESGVTPSADWEFDEDPSSYSAPV
jgi:hypothetical protein